MIKQLKRNKDKYNPYTIEVREEKYYVVFKDGNNVLQEISITKEVYDAFDKFELEDISQIHKIRKHIEHNEVYEETLYQRSAIESISVEDEVSTKIINEELRSAINELNEIQKRRIIKYYFYDKTYEEIAKEENCTKRAVKFSIDIGIEKISKKIKF